MDMLSLMPDTIIRGRWQKRRYIVKGQLGQGGIATVYLVQDVRTKEMFAMKISADNISINREYQLLKNFSNIDMVVRVYEIDDLEIYNRTYYYILLEYIKGEDLESYFKRRKLDIPTTISIILIILRGLDKIYAEEYIIGDLKLSNLMLDRELGRIRMIDLASGVKKGQSLKEFTLAYDRASWNCGDRTAEPSYLLFTVNMIFIKLLMGESPNPRKYEINALVKRIKTINLSRELQALIIQGLSGHYKSFGPYLAKLKKIYYKERYKQYRDKRNLKNRRVNCFLAFSIFFFIATVVTIYLT